MTDYHESMNNYTSIQEYYEECFEKYGDTPQGLAWQDAESMEKRFEVMAGLLRGPWQGSDANTPLVGLKILDLGCGTGKFFRFLEKYKPLYLWNSYYVGMDISPKFIEFCKNKYPKTIEFLSQDILKDPLEPKSYDYIVMNGILTVKDKLSFDEMWSFAQDIIKAAYEGAARGIAFNVMSKQVDWERDDLFHLPLDTLADFLTKNVSRNFIIRNDYGLYEYTVYVYRNSV